LDFLLCHAAEFAHYDSLIFGNVCSADELLASPASLHSDITTYVASRYTEGTDIFSHQRAVYHVRWTEWSLTLDTYGVFFNLLMAQGAYPCHCFYIWRYNKFYKTQIKKE